jgi:hypothetical protein
MEGFCNYLENKILEEEHLAIWWTKREVTDPAKRNFNTLKVMRQNEYSIRRHNEI